MKVAIFGAGGIAQRAYLPLLTSWPGIEISGIYSRTQTNSEKVSRQWHIQFSTSDFDKLLNTKPDAALVLTNNATHYLFAKKLLEAGVDVFVEKPLAETTAEVCQLADIADKHKRILMAGFNRRYALLYQQAKQLFTDKKIQMGIFEKHRNLVSHTSLYNNYLDDTIHQIDLMRYFCGELEPKFTQAQIVNGRVAGAVSLAKLKDGGSAILMTSLQAGAWQERVTLHGENCTVEVEAFRQLKVKLADHEEVYGVDRPGKWIADMKERGFYGAIEHFLDCVKTRKQPLTNGQDAQKTHELIDALVACAGSVAEKPEGEWDKVDRWSDSQ